MRVFFKSKAVFAALFLIFLPVLGQQNNNDANQALNLNYNNVWVIKSEDLPDIAKIWESTFNGGIKGDLEAFEDLIFFKNCTFGGDVSFKGAHFNSTIFAYSHFKMTSNFVQTKFHKQARFANVNFDSSLILSDVHFYDELNFNDAKLNGGLVSFENTRFHSTTSFENTTFRTNTEFAASKFMAFAKFNNARFLAETDFRDVSFSKNVSFRDVIFHSKVNMKGVQFKNKADFSGAKFKGKINFKNMQLPDTLDFRNVEEITEDVELIYAKPPGKNKKCKIALFGANIDKINFNLRFFKLCFPDSGKISAQELNQQKTIVYEKVLKKFKEEFLTSDYEKLDIEYNRYKYDSDAYYFGFGAILNFMDDYWWKYGYHKYRVIIWTIAALLVFTIINFFCLYNSLQRVYQLDFLPLYHKRPRMVYPRTAPVRLKKVDFLEIGKHFFYSLVYSSVIFFGVKLDTHRFVEKKIWKKTNHLLFSYILLMFTAGIIYIGFLVNFIFQN